MTPVRTRLVRSVLGLAVIALFPIPGRSDEPAPKEKWTVELRQRVRKPGTDDFEVTRKTAAWDPKQTAIIVVDMWDGHHCKSAAQRVAEMAPHMNEVLKSARAKGVLIIHSPSDCMDQYEKTPARQRAQGTAKAKAAVLFRWNYFNPKQEGALADKLEKAGCSCDTPEPCGPDKRAWKKQIATLEIADADAVSDNGQEVYNLLQERGIVNVIVMGVHTNRCVLGRPFGIRQMAYLGKNVVLCRDLTDSYHRNPGRHFEGLRQIVAHIEMYWCPTINSKSITGKPAFRFKEDKLGPDHEPAALAPDQKPRAVTGAEKKEFIELLEKLPTEKEFFTDEAVKKAGPYLRVLLALTEKDIEKPDIYPFLALCRGLCDQKKDHRDYAVKHFGSIGHPTIKMFWGAMLFDENAASPEIVKYLQTALDSKEQAKLLSEMLGPQFEDFKKRQKDYINRQVVPAP